MEEEPMSRARMRMRESLGLRRENCDALDDEIRMINDKSNLKVQMTCMGSDVCHLYRLSTHVAVKNLFDLCLVKVRNDHADFSETLAQREHA